MSAGVQVIPVGTIAWASCAPSFRPPGPHALVVVRDYANGNVGVAFVTHATDLLRVGVRITRADCPSAFRNCGGPLTDERGLLAFVDDRNIPRVAIADPVARDRLRIGGIDVVLTHVVKLPSVEWQTLRKHIHTALGTQI